MRVLITGGRNRADRPYICGRLDAIHAGKNISILIEGGARGVDEIGRDWARSRGIHVATVPALWSELGRGAGPKRNEAMLELRPHLVVAFPAPDSVGTLDMVRRARRAGLPVVVLPPPS